MQVCVCPWYTGSSLLLTVLTRALNVHLFDFLDMPQLQLRFDNSPT